MAFRHIIQRGSHYLNLKHMVRAQVFKDKGQRKWSAIFEFNGSKDSTKVGWKFKKQKEAHQFVKEAMEEANTGSIRRITEKEIQHLD